MKGREVELFAPGHTACSVYKLHNQDLHLSLVDPKAPQIILVYHRGAKKTESRLWLPYTARLSKLRESVFAGHEKLEKGSISEYNPETRLRAKPGGKVKASFSASPGYSATLRCGLQVFPTVKMHLHTAQVVSRRCFFWILNLWWSEMGLNCHEQVSWYYSEKHVPCDSMGLNSTSVSSNTLIRNKSHYPLYWSFPPGVIERIK